MRWEIKCTEALLSLALSMVFSLLCLRTSGSALSITRCTGEMCFSPRVTRVFTGEERIRTHERSWWPSLIKERWAEVERHGERWRKRVDSAQMTSVMKVTNFIIDDLLKLSISLAKKRTLVTHQLSELPATCEDEEEERENNLLDSSIRGDFAVRIIQEVSPVAHVQHYEGERENPSRKFVD